MTIQINTDKILSVQEAFNTNLDYLLSEKLSQYKGHIMRLDVHLSEEHVTHSRFSDKKCLLEVRLEGRQPIAVTVTANSYELAVNTAIIELKIAIETILNRITTHHRSKYF